MSKKYFTLAFNLIQKLVTRPALKQTLSVFVKNEELRDVRALLMAAQFTSAKNLNLTKGAMINKLCNTPPQYQAIPLINDGNLDLSFGDYLPIKNFFSKENLHTLIRDHRFLTAIGIMTSLIVAAGIFYDLRHDNVLVKQFNALTNRVLQFGKQPNFWQKSTTRPPQQKSEEPNIAFFFGA